MQMRPMMPEDGSILQPIHDNMQRSVSTERGNTASQQKRMGTQRSVGMARRPLRTVPLVPLEDSSGISTRKESAQAIWNYVGDTGEIVPTTPTAPALNEAINGDSFIQPAMPSGEWLRQKAQGYPGTGGQEKLRPQSTRKRQVRSTSAAMQGTGPAAIILPTTAPLNSPYDHLLPSWELRRKRDTIFLMLLTLLVLGILGIMSCNYLLSLYHV